MSSYFGKGQRIRGTQYSIPYKEMNHLLQKICDIFAKETNKADVLDLGCGDGDYSIRLNNLGFNVTAADIDEKRFKYSKEVPFEYCDITKTLPFADRSFDYVLLMEVFEHLRNPYSVLKEINRIIKPNGFLILSTPNILNLKSRFRFIFEGNYEYFREPPLDQVSNPKETIFNLHLVPYRYQELEYLLFANGFKISGIHASIYESRGLSFLLPVIALQAWLKERRAKMKGGIDYQRINNILLSRELLFGRHLIVKAEKL